MTNIRTGTLSGIAVSTAAPTIRIKQLAAIAVESEAPPKIRLGSFAMIAVISGNINRTIMGPLFRLPCWQPCTAYGTRALIVDFSKIRKAP
jgi:hypothetical protein